MVACLQKGQIRDLVEDSYLKFADLIWSVELKSFSTSLPATVLNPTDNTDNLHGEQAKKINRNDKEKWEKDPHQKTNTAP